MSQELFQLQNGEILVSKDNKTYADTLSNFKLDYSNCPAFTSAFIMYNRSLSQYVLGNTIQTYGTQKDLDTIIDSIDSIITAQTQRNTPTQTFASVQSAKLSAVDSAASAAYSAGFASTANGTTLYYDSDENERLNYISAANLAVSNTTQFNTEFPNGFPIHSRTALTAADSTKVTQHLDAAQIQQLGTDWRTRVMSVKAQVWALKTEINACTTVTEIEAITISIT
ncbi:DUF4376 domain-containing protein [Pectinatus frisingensis]|uniref:DUF4376 domain-containing protein n=1 Tax=Pectinatus frisingensis TaxID=865 RepID=UPI0018C61383|nr:DUF4376 domain-containing protein [Pectinatus frisingensis]